VTPYEPGHFDKLRAKHPYPGGWRPSTHATDAEIAAAGNILDLIRERYERLQKPTLLIQGVEYAKRSYLRRLADMIAGPPHPFTTNCILKEFLLRHSKSVTRRRVHNTVYYNVTQFAKMWHRKHITSRQTENLRSNS
jgi:hypothetical protein